MGRGREKEREREIDLLSQLSMHPLVVSSMHPDWDGTRKVLTERSVMP